MKLVSAKNKKMANKGMYFENEVKKANDYYKMNGQALIQRISTPWQVRRAGKKIISAFPVGKSTLDFRGTVKGGLSISFDCKESEDERGLPLKHIQPHQIKYMRNAILVNETTFLLCLIKPLDKRFYIPGDITIQYWDRWQQNKGKRGFNFIPTQAMKQLQFKNIYLDYLKILEG